MATITQLSSLVFLLVFFANSQVLSSSSTTEPTISASPAPLPYVTAPDISSFFPTPTSADRPVTSAAPPEADAPALTPTSGEFVGKKSSNSARLDCAAAIAGVLFSSFLVTRMVV